MANSVYNTGMKRSNNTNERNEMKNTIKNFLAEMTLFLIWGLLAMFAIFGGTAWLLNTL